MGTKEPIHSGKSDRPAFWISFVYLFLCILSSNYICSNMTWHANAAECFVMVTIMVVENKNKTFVFSLSVSFQQSSLSPSLSMWLRVCNLIGRVVWDPVAACLEDWHNNTGRQHLSGKGRGGGHSRQVKNYAGFLIKCIQIQLRIKRNENNLCAGEDNMWETENGPEDVWSLHWLPVDCVFLVITGMRVCWCVSSRVQLNLMWQCKLEIPNNILNNVFFLLQFPLFLQQKTLKSCSHASQQNLQCWINSVGVN